jgi:Fe-Mn family superoxide dismutase
MAHVDEELDHRSAPYAATPAVIDDALRIDVRRQAVFDSAPTLLPDARWCDPAAVAAWQAELPRDQPVLVYCVHGHAVSRGVVMALRAAGVQAWFLSGGIEAWQAAGRPVVPRPA